MSIHDLSVLKSAEQWRNLTFIERKDMLVETFRTFKSRVDKMMHGWAREEYVLLPGTLLKNSKANRHNNDSRIEYLREGRKGES